MTERLLVEDDEVRTDRDGSASNVPDLHVHPRIVVVGNSGSGKTTFAGELARILGRPFIELDSLYWGENWVARPGFRDRVVAEIQGPTWVVDGNYGSVRDLVWPRATVMIWLNLPRWLVAYRIIARTARRFVTRERVFHGNRESLRMALGRESIIRYSLRSHRKFQHRYENIISDPFGQHLNVLEVKSAREARMLLARTGEK